MPNRSSSYGSCTITLALALLGWSTVLQWNQTGCIWMRSPCTKYFQSRKRCGLDVLSGVGKVGWDVEKI